MGEVEERRNLHVICVAGRRLRRFAEAIQQGHEFGSGPGVHDEPWSLDFQRLCVAEVYLKTLSWGYLVDTGAAFADCADLMVLNLRETREPQDWLIVQQFLRSSSEAIREAAPDDIDLSRTKTADDITSRAPAVMPFGSLATLVSAQGAARLAAAGGGVERTCSRLGGSPLSESEQDWLSRLSRGDRTIDIARDHGYSERSLYRALSELWTRLGVQNRSEGIALATKNDWLN